MLERTYHTIGTDGSVSACMEALGFRATRIEDANFPVLTGGADISPEIYLAPAHPTTYASPYRDIRELEALEKRKPGCITVGICRGAQMLCALNGGHLWQDVDNHAGRDHKVHYLNEHGVYEEHVVNSLHHQMMNPARGPVQVWGTSEPLCTYRDISAKTRMGRGGLPEFEVLWYPLTKSFCFQAHPEYDATTTRTFFMKCLTRAINLVEAGPH